MSMNYQAYLALKIAAIDDAEKEGGLAMLQAALLSADLMEEARIAYSEVKNHFATYVSGDFLALKGEAAAYRSRLIAQLRHC